MMRAWVCGLAWGMAAALAAGGSSVPGPNGRVVFLGDSITDGFTYPLLVQQALRDAGKPVPTLINAAIAGDTAEGMLGRIERDVLPHEPTVVSLSVGINDVLRGVTPALYEQRVRAIAERLKKQGVPLLVMTTTILGPRHADKDQELAAFNAALRKLAEENQYRLADANAAMQKARKAGQGLLEADEVHLNYAGYRVVARAVLDALGHPDVPVPRELRLSPMPGILREWQVRGVDAKTPFLTQETVAALVPDQSWTTYVLPEPEPVEGWWLDQERQRGFAMSLPKYVGEAGRYQGVAVVEAKVPRRVFFNTGADLKSAWLNGERIYRNTGWRGWHAGKERIPATLRAGRNLVVIESGPQFFLSLTETNTW